MAKTRRKGTLKRGAKRTRQGQGGGSAAPARYINDKRRRVRAARTRTESLVRKAHELHELTGRSVLVAVLPAADEESRGSTHGATTWPPPAAPRSSATRACFGQMSSVKRVAMAATHRPPPSGARAQNRRAPSRGSALVRTARTHPHLASPPSSLSASPSPRRVSSLWAACSSSSRSPRSSASCASSSDDSALGDSVEEQEEEEEEEANASGSESGSTDESLADSSASGLDFDSDDMDFY